MIQLQGDQRKDVHEFLTKPSPTKEQAQNMTEKDKVKYGLGIKAATVKVSLSLTNLHLQKSNRDLGPRFLSQPPRLVPVSSSQFCCLVGDEIK